MKFTALGRKSVSVQVGIFIAAVMAAVCAVFLAEYGMISNSLTEQNIRYTSRTLEQIAVTINERTDNLEGILNSIGYDTNMAKYLCSSAPDIRFEAYRELTSQATRFGLLIRQIRFFFALGNNDNDFFSGGRRFYYGELFENLPCSDDYYYQFLDGDDTRPEIRSSFVLIAPLYDIWGQTTTYNLGRVAVVVDRDYLTISNFQGSYGMGLYLIDRDRIVRSCNRENDVPEDIADSIIAGTDFTPRTQAFKTKLCGETYIVDYTYLEPLEGYLLAVTPLRAVHDEISWLRTIAVWMIAALIAVLFFLLYLMRHVLTTPLHQFAAHLRSIRGKDGDRTVSLSGCAEIEEISLEFNRLLGREEMLTDQLVQAREKLYRTELLKKQAELSWLKSQLDPHFLYNTLEASIGLAYTEDARRTAQTLRSLSRILRYSVKGAERVPLRQELEIIRAYISIQNVRFCDAFDVEYRFDEGVLDIELPKMILQPIVENAIVHGLEPKGSGHLLIEGHSLRPGRIRLCVEDDGLGMDEETLSRMRTTLERGAGAGAEGIGIANIADRLRLLCGDVTFSVWAGPNLGCRVEIDIPISQQEGGNGKDVRSRSD